MSTFSDMFISFSGFSFLFSLMDPVPWEVKLAFHIFGVASFAFGLVSVIFTSLAEECVRGFFSGNITFGPLMWQHPNQHKIGCEFICPCFVTDFAQRSCNVLFRCKFLPPQRELIVVSLLLHWQSAKQSWIQIVLSCREYPQWSFTIFHLLPQLSAFSQQVSSITNFIRCRNQLNNLHSEICEFKTTSNRFWKPFSPALLLKTMSCNFFFQFSSWHWFHSG